jgi:peptidyl-Asp metalloendopeptidase
MTTKHSVLLSVILLFGVIFWGCSELEPTASNEETEGFALSEQEVTAEDSLFVIVSDPQLTEEQERLVAVIKNRPTTAGLHFANLVIDPQNLLKEGKTLGMPLPDEKLFVAVGERATVNKMGYLSWIGKSENPLNTASLVLGPEGELGGSLRAEGSYYRFEPLGGDLLAIILIDPSKFPPEHPPLHH